MRYSATHKAETRQHLLKTTGSLAKKNGFANTGVDALMAAAGLTSGAFYNHFGSKTELFSELIKQELEHSLTMIADDADGDSTDEWIARQLKRYLTWKHVQSPDSGCAVPSLAAEIARADKPTKKTFEDAMKRVHAVWAAQLKDDKAAWAAITQLVGAILIARAMASEKTGKEVLDANKAVLESMLSLRSDR
ncbi:TetR/AcrR family transcriptional regulator [Herbaspirillum sp. HC18]|nr:TetR/AcrR family transcriptional regulator [Herbaspirillum sp. HC18]